MSFAIMPLEERIVFNAVIDGLDNSGDDAPDNQTPDPTDSADAKVDDAVAYDGTGGAESQPAARVLLVSSAVDPALASAARSDVIVIQYDASNATTETILSQLIQALNGRKAESIGFAVHGGENGSFVLARNSIVSLSTLPSQQEFWTAVGSNLTETGRVDLLSCNLTATESGAQLVASLENLTGHNFAASDDLTGNPSSGGDWNLETDNVDAEAVYFDEAKLESFRGNVVDFAPVIDGFNWENQPNYNMGGAPVKLDVMQNSTATDQDSTGYGGAQGFLKFSISMNANAADLLSLNNLGHTGGYSQSGNELYKDGSVIGLVSGGAGGSELVINWNAAATDADVTYFLHRAQFSTTNVGAGQRDIQIYLSDAAGNGSVAPAKMLSVYINGPTVERAIATNIPSSGSVITLTQAILNTTDPDNPGLENLTYNIFSNFVQNGELWVNRNGTNWQQANWGPFTQAEINNGWVEYRHTSGNALHDRFSFYVMDNTNARSLVNTLYFTGSDTAPSVTIDSAMQTTYMSSLMEMSCSPFLTLSDDSYKFESLTFTVRSRPDSANERIYIHPDQIAMVQAQGISVTTSYDQIRFYKSGGSSVDNFRMAASYIQYYHTIENRSPGDRYIDIVANDGTQNSATSTWTVHLEESGGQPQLMNSYLQAPENSITVLTGTNLQTIDSNTPASSLVYRLESLPTNGRLMLNGVPVPVNGSFTQQQVYEGRLQYRHDFPGTSWDNFFFSVTDGSTTLTNMYFNISIFAAGDPVYNNPINPVNPIDPMTSDPIVNNPVVNPVINPINPLDPINPANNTGTFIANNNNPILNRDNLITNQAKDNVNLVKEPINNVARNVVKEIGDKLGEAGVGPVNAAIVNNAIDNAQQMAEQHGLTGDIMGQAQNLTQEGQAGLTDIRQAFSFAMQAYTAKAGASSSFLGDVVNAIRQSEVMTTRANIVIDNAFDTVTRLNESARAIVQDQIRYVVAYRREVQLANQRLSDILDTALKAGRVGRFDKAYSDAVESSIRNLVQRNEQLQVNESVLRNLVESDANADFKQVSESARQQAEQAVQDARSLQDKAAGDENDASIRELLDQQQQEKPVDQPQGRLSPDRDQALEDVGSLLALTGVAGSISAATGERPSITDNSLTKAREILAHTKTLLLN